MEDQAQPRTDNGFFQVIDPEGHWGEGLQTTLEKWGFTNKGFNYWAVSILGCQSSGKSTLLNLLFDTKFEVMEASLGRTQTTKGVWMSRSVADTKDILVLDVEGTDGRERGEEQKSFERKSSLFSLALAEVLIINMWHQDIGRHDAANYGLLKTVFELNLQLFGRANKSAKTLLLFVIRDHVRQATPLEKLQATLEADLTRLWRGITKPEEFTDSTVHDFFDIVYTSLPHKLLQEADFYAEAALLKQRFRNADAPGYIFKDAYTKDVPADGWSIYAKRIWETIMDSRDLDLPSQKEMLAMFRCDEIKASALVNFSQALEPLRKHLNSKKESFVEAFGAAAQQRLDQCLAEYDVMASRYHAEVAAQKRQELQAQAAEIVYALFILQLGKVREASLHLLESRIAAATTAPPAPSQPSSSSSSSQAQPKAKAIKDFAALRATLTEETLQFFSKHAQESLLPGASWTFTAEQEAIEDLVAQRLLKLQLAQLDVLLLAQEKKIRKAFFGPLSKLLEAADDDMWPRIAQVYDKVAEEAQERLHHSLQGYHIDEETKAKRTKDLLDRLFKVLKEKLTEKTQHILYAMEKRFDEHFRLDEQGLPKKWRKADNVQEKFKAARDKAYAVLDLYSIIRLRPEHQRFSFLDENCDPADINAELVVIPQEQCLITKDRFRKESEAAYVQALREQEDNSPGGRIPGFFWAIMCILGFNEFVALISNPILFILLIIFGVIMYAAWLAGLLDIPIQIFQELTNSAMGEAKSWAVKSVVSRLTQPSANKEKND